MLRPVSTLPLSKSAILELAKSACHYVEDIKNSNDWAHKYDETVLNPLTTTVSALDLLQDEVEQDNILTLCEDLDNILHGGLRCGCITEICGAYGTGKTQICLQTSVTSQLPEECGGLSAEMLYIDTRNGFSARRIQDIIRGCQKRFPNVSLNEDEIMKGIKVSSPQNLEDLLLTVHTLKKRFRTDSKIRLVILDSLSLMVQCTFADGWQRTQFYFRMIDELQEIADRNSVAVIIVNELRSHMDADGKIAYESAGGQLVAHKVHKRLVVARLNDSTFAARLLKSPTLPQVSIKFQITQDGVRSQ